MIMKALKNNPYDLLEEEHIPKNLLTEKTLNMLTVFDETFEDIKKHPENEIMRKMGEDIGQKICELVIEDIQQIKAEAKNEIEEEEKTHAKKQRSKKIKEKATVILDDLDICRQKLKEDRKRKVESGEIQPPKKKTLVTKLRLELIKTASLIPEKLKDDENVIKRTQRAVLNFLNELKSIWGLNKIKPIEDDIKEKFKKLEEQLTK